MEIHSYQGYSSWEAHLGQGGHKVEGGGGMSEELIKCVKCGRIGAEFAIRDPEGDFGYWRPFCRECGAAEMIMGGDLEIEKMKYMSKRWKAYWRAGN